MATIGYRKIILYDRWPGPVNPNMSVPTNGFDSTVEGSGNCVTTAAFDVGTKLMAYNDGTYNPGWYTMCYMQFAEGSDSAYDAAPDSTSGYSTCFHYCATQHHPDGNNAGTWYVVTHDLTNSDGTLGGPVAVPCCCLSGADTTTTGAEFGWFWVGGVCPCMTSPRTDFTRMGGDGVITDGSVVSGALLMVQDDGTNAAEFCTLECDATKHEAGCIGIALGADA